MKFEGQKILPAIRQIKDFEKVVVSDKFEYIVLLDTHIANLKNLMQMAKMHNKKILLHVDLVQGLKNDEHGIEYICQEIKPEGIISTRANTLIFAKKHHLITVQRVFLLDSMSLETSYGQFERVNPDYVEVLPGIVPTMIKEFKNAIDIPIIAGGLIRSIEEVNQAINAGAKMVSTSLPKLWNQA